MKFNHTTISHMKAITNKLMPALRRKVAGIGGSTYSLGGDLKTSIRPFIMEIWRIAKICFKGDIGNRIRLFNNFYLKIRRIEKNHGTMYTIKYLKACQVSIQRVIAKSPYRTLRELEPDLPFPRLYSGLPSIIPLTDRKLIRSNHKGVIRYWLTLFGIFRVLRGPIKSKLDSITDPYSGTQEILIEFSEFCSTHLWRLLSSVNFNPKQVIVEGNTFVHNTSSGPNNSFAMGSVLTDLWWFINDKAAYRLFQDYAEATDSHLGYLMDRYIKLSHKAIPNGATVPIKGRFAVDGSIHQGSTELLEGDMYHFWSPYSTSVDSFVGGQLSFKEEAAGKLRIFAMVDIWTQSILNPLHKSIYRLLKDHVPNDGTSNQEAAFKRVLEKSKNSGKAWSVDLSAATDRLPIDIQSNIVSLLCNNNKVGIAWKRLLVDRDYLIAGSEKKLESYGLKPQRIRYAVGQPMGALSSFAMLGLTHHMIVQYAAHISLGPQMKWYSEYEIVGDDIVLFNEEVYKAYWSLLERFGMPANPSKSIPSPTTSSAEFLKRTALNGEDLSPISWKELLQGNNLPGKVNLLLRLIDRSLILNTTSIKAVLCRFSSDLEKGLTPFAKHGMISIISSIFLRKFKTLYPSLCILINPKTSSRGRVDYSKIDIPSNQVMKMISEIDSITTIEDISKYFSHWNLREHHAQRGLVTMISKQAIKTAYELLLEVKENREVKISTFASMLMNFDNLQVEDKNDKYRGVDLFKNIDYRVLKLKSDVNNIARRILIGESDDLEQRLAVLESKHFKAPLRGIPLDVSLKLLDETTLYCSKFSLEKTRHGVVPVDNKVSILAIAGQKHLTPAWQSFLNFHVDFIQLISAESKHYSSNVQIPSLMPF